MAPAQAAGQTVGVQLTLSGLASSDNPTGGSTVGVHPGDSVKLTASAIPTAGAPAGLGGTLGGLLGGVADFQVRIAPGTLPGIDHKITLDAQGKCGGGKSLTLPSLAKGTYSFTYTAYQVTFLPLGGCNTAKITPTRDQLGALTQDNIKVTDTGVYSGRIVVANDPPQGQIGVQLPKQSVSVKAGPVHTSVNLPGATVGVPNPVPSITKVIGGVLSKVPGVPGSKSGGKSSGKSGSSVKYTPPPLTVPERVMPHAVNFGGAGGSYVAPAGDPGNGGTVGAPVVAPAQPTTMAAGPPAASTVDATPAKKQVDLSQRDQLSGQQLPVLLAILAILALSVVTAGYARMYLLRKH
jgi:hypothetical protein